ncbi:MAG: sugar phosphate isomerase/epimerase [Verrucomicrobia bacterium]|nr:sugar phosphate isomerase/epimerase [Verrucomicrobiota bacterium]MCH8526264.1 sugar phosphate isomerase/epimerase [Kiritimatiellia bacterium]
MIQDGFSISDKAFAPGVSVEENLRRIRAAGFTHLHLAWKWTKPEPFTAEERAEWAEALAASGVRVQDVHGCHPRNVDLWSPEAKVREQALALFRDRIALTRAFGGDAVVYHVPWRGAVTREEIDFLLEGLAALEETAREHEVKIAIENHYIAGNDRRTLEAVFERFPADFIGFTFDPGHALISGNSEWLMAHCASRLEILHLNDNDTQKDRHWNPFDPEGHADWDAIAAFIRRSVYRKAPQLEVSWTPERHGEHGAFLEAAFQAAERIRALIQEA